MSSARVVQRPRRLLRSTLGWVGALLLLASGADIAVRLLGGSALFPITLWTAVIAAFVGFASVAASAVISVWVSTRLVSAPNHGLEIDMDLLTHEEARTEINQRQAFVFWQALHDPGARFSRISETVEQGTRSFRVSTSFAVETGDLGPDLHALPIAFFKRGRLEHGLSFSNGERVSSLSHVKSVAYTSAVVERFVRLAGRRAFSAYRSEGHGCPSLKARVTHILASTSPDGADAIDTVTDAIAGLPSTPRRREMLYAAATVVAYLAEQYPVCVYVSADPDEPVRRLTMERVTFPRVTPYARQVTGIRARLEYFRKRVIDLQRHAFGVVAHTVDYPTKMAERTASYHLNIRGPEGFYLAHQELRDNVNEGRTLSASKLSQLEYAMNQRRGQRTGHLYARNGKRFGDLLYSCAFYERMPGSLSTAFVGAATTTLIAWVLAWSVLHTQNEQSGLLQILLAFPLALTATSSSRSGAPFWGGDLRARWTTIITVGVLILALVASTFGTSWARHDQELFWAWLGVVAAGNAVVCGLFWIARAMTHHKFLRR